MISTRLRKVRETEVCSGLRAGQERSQDSEHLSIPNLTSCPRPAAQALLTAKPYPSLTPNPLLGGPVASGGPAGFGSVGPTGQPRLAGHCLCKDLACEPLCGCPGSCPVSFLLSGSEVTYVTSVPSLSSFPRHALLAGTRLPVQDQTGSEGLRDRAGSFSPLVLAAVTPASESGNSPSPSDPALGRTGITPLTVEATFWRVMEFPGHSYPGVLPRKGRGLD